MIPNTKNMAQSSFANFSGFQVIFLLSRYSESYYHYKFLLGYEDLTLGHRNTNQEAWGAQVLCDIEKKYMMGWVRVSAVAYKSTENWHDSSFCSIIYSAGGSCSNNFHFSLCLAFPSSGSGRSTVTQAFKSMNLWRNLAKNPVAPIQLKAKQLLPAVARFYLDELLREIRNCPPENL